MPSRKGSELRQLTAESQQPTEHFVYCCLLNKHVNPRNRHVKVVIRGRSWAKALSSLQDDFVEAIKERWEYDADPLTLEFWKIEDDTDPMDIQSTDELSNSASFKPLSDLKTPEQLNLKDAVLVVTAEPRYRRARFVFLDDECKEEAIMGLIEVPRASESRTLEELLPSFERGVATTREIGVKLTNVKFYRPIVPLDISWEVSDWTSIEKTSIMASRPLRGFLQQLENKDSIHFILTGKIESLIASSLLFVSIYQARSKNQICELAIGVDMLDQPLSGLKESILKVLTSHYGALSDDEMIIKYWKLNKPVKKDVVDDKWIELVNLRKMAKLLEQDVVVKTLLLNTDADSLDILLEVNDEAHDQVSEMIHGYRDIIDYSGKPPSECAKSTEYVKNQANRSTAIYDGRYTIPKGDKPPPVTIAPPVQIYHEVFGRFVDRLHNRPPSVSAEMLEKTYAWMIKTASIRDAEQSITTSNILSDLRAIIDVDMRETVNADGTRADRVYLLGHHDILVVIVEVKREFGEGGCDASTQAGLSYRQHWIQPTVADISKHCACPSFLIATGGPWLAVLGAVMPDKPIVQRLTDMMWLGISTMYDAERVWRVAMTLETLRESIIELREYYQKLLSSPLPEVGLTLERFFPYPNSFIQDGTSTRYGFTYTNWLEHDPTCVTLAAKIDSTGEAIVVKFVTRYGVDVHQFLAARHHAPALRYIGPLDGSGVQTSDTNSGQRLGTDEYPVLPLRMVVMDYIKHTKHTKDSRPQIEEILRQLHSEGFVFGDLRPPNVLRDAQGNIQFIDFDWAGRYDNNPQSANLEFLATRDIQVNTDTQVSKSQIAHYPINIAEHYRNIDGVGNLKPIQPRHDWEMLDRFKFD